MKRKKIRKKKKKRSKGKEEKKRYISEVEENNRMGNTRDLFKKIRYTKGTFHAKMSTIKDRYGPNRRGRY